MNRHAAPGPPSGCPYDAVGMQRALDSAIGLPSRATSALWILVFLMPADVRRSLIMSSLAEGTWPWRAAAVAFIRADHAIVRKPSVRVPLSGTTVVQQ